jgi:hypothetical protein
MFRNYPSFGQLFCYDMERHSYDLLTSGHGRLALGRASVRSRVTEDSEEICFAVLHLGDQNLSAAVKRFSPSDEAGWAAFDKNARAAVRRADLPELIRLIDRFFGGTTYSLTSLFADEQHRILTNILNQTLEQVESSLIRIYEEHATLLHFLGENNFAAPPALALTSTFAINASLRRVLESDSFDPAEVTRLLRRAELDNVTLDFPLLSFTADKRMKRAMINLEETVESQNLTILNETLNLAESIQSLPMDINIWQAQNIWNDMLRRSNSQYWTREWRELFLKLGAAMNIAVEELVTEESVRAF